MTIIKILRKKNNYRYLNQSNFQEFSENLSPEFKLQKKSPQQEKDKKDAKNSKDKKDAAKKLMKKIEITNNIQRIKF